MTKVPTAKDIDSMIQEQRWDDIVALTKLLTPDDLKVWEFWGYDGRTFEQFMKNYSNN